MKYTLMLTEPPLTGNLQAYQSPARAQHKTLDADSFDLHAGMVFFYKSGEVVAAYPFSRVLAIESELAK